MTSTLVWPSARELRALCTWLLFEEPKRPLTREALCSVTRLRDLSLPRRPSQTALEARCRTVLEWRQRRNASLVLFHDAAYPPLLREIARPPLALFVEGQIEPLHHPIVAVVGSRAASSEYVDWTRDLAADLARAGLTVASGQARGIDRAAHQGALDAAGATLAVLGTGTDVVYPPEHDELQHDIQRDGCVVSEFLPGTQPLAWHFPRRNRILAGLSKAVVVVQAEKRSGALSTAHHALSENREVLAVPGSVTDPRSRGTHELLRQGATLVEAAPDVVQALGLTPGSAARSSVAALLAQLSRPRDVGALHRALGWDVATFQRTLAELELSGWIEHDARGRVRRVSRG